MKKVTFKSNGINYSFNNIIDVTISHNCISDRYISKFFPESSFHEFNYNNVTDIKFFDEPKEQKYSLQSSLFGAEYINCAKNITFNELKSLLTESIFDNTNFIKIIKQ